jgi:hypothetical protein
MEVEIRLRAFLTSTLDGNYVVSFVLRKLESREGAPVSVGLKDKWNPRLV